ncbi:MAG: hypothetical protein AAF502_24245 [Bacteroidota bacterium]
MNIFLLNTTKRFMLIGLAFFVGLFGLKANQANISCGDPTETGNVTVEIVVRDANGNKTTIKWNTAIHEDDDDLEKAEKIRAAAPSNATGIDSIAGSSNAVVAGSSEGFTILSMRLRQDETKEDESHNVFSFSIGEPYGGFALSGTPTGLTPQGDPGFVTLGTGSAFATIPTFPGMTTEDITFQAFNMLQAQGLPVDYLLIGDPLQSLIADDLNNDFLMLTEIDPITGFYIDIKDEGITLDFGGIFDNTMLFPPATPTLFQGLLTAGLGQAQTNLSPEGNLVVSNIGSSGEDGVSINLGESRGTEVRFDATHPQYPLLQTLTLGASGSMGGTPGLPLGLLEVIDNGAGFTVTADYSSGGTTSMRIEVVNEGQIIHVIEGYTDPIIATTTEQPHRCGKRIRPGTGGPFLPPPLLCYYIGPDYGNPLPWNIPGHGTYFGDELRVLAENGNAPVDYISDFSIQFIGPNDLLINDLFLDMFEQFHQGLGQTQMSANGDHLTVSNIGSSGLDGVSIDLGEDTKAFEMEWLPLAPATGANIHIESSGICGGVEMPLGWIDITEVGGQYHVFADYSIGGTSTMLIEIYLNGEIIDYIPMQQNDPSSPRVILPDPPGGCGKGIPRGGLYCYRIPYPAPVACTIPGYGTVMGDEIRLLAENGACAIEHLTQFEVTMSGYPELIVTNEATTGADETKLQELTDCILSCSGEEISASEKADCIADCLSAYNVERAACEELGPRFDPTQGYNGVSENFVLLPGEVHAPSAGLFDFSSSQWDTTCDGICTMNFYYNFFGPGSEPFLPLPWIPLGAGIFDGTQWVGPPLPLIPDGTIMMLRAELLGHPFGPLNGYNFGIVDDGCGPDDLTPPLFVDSFFDVAYDVNPYLGMHWVGDHQSLHVFDPFGLPILLTPITLTSVADVVPDPRKNGSFWVADSTKVRCYNSKGEQVGSDIPTTGKADVVPDPRNNGGFWAADSTKVRCYDQDGDQVGSDINTEGKGKIVPDPRNNGAFWVADTVKVRCYNQNGQQVGNDISTTGQGEIVPDPRNNGAFWVSDSTKVRCYDQDGDLVGTIITNTKSTVVPDPRNNGAFWVVDDNRIRCYDQNGKLRTTVTTNGKGTIVPDPRNNGAFWVADADGVRCFDRRGRQQGNTITTNGKACIIPDPRNNGAFWIADDDGVRCFNNKGQQIGGTIATIGKGGIIPDPRNNGAFWVADSTKVRCYNQNGQQVGGDITTEGKSTIVPDPRNNGAFWIADDEKVRCYNQNGQQVGSDVTTNGKADIIPDPRRNGGFWVVDEDNVRCYDQNGQQINSLALASRAHITPYSDPYLVPIPIIADNCSGVRLTNDYTFGQDASDYYPVGITPVLFTATDANGNSADVTVNVTIRDQVQMDMSMMMQGPYDISMQGMLALLYQQELLPPVEPYSGFGFTPVNPGEVAPILEQPFMPSLPPGEMPIDWIYVRVFQAPTASSNELTGKVGLLYGDGSIRNPDGSPFTIDFPDGVARPDEGYINFVHRTHLQAWTIDPVNFLTLGGTVDMTDPTVPLPTDAIIQVSPGVMTIAGGDGNTDGIIDAADRSGTWNFRNAVGYLPWDINLDGVVDAADRVLPWNNRNLTSE